MSERRSPRQRWGTCCPSDPECEHSLLDGAFLSRHMDMPLTDLEAEMVRYGWGRDAVVDILRHPDLLIAALIESGWRPTDEELRAMGGTPVELTNTDWPIDLGTCAYNQRGKPGADPDGSCSFGCYDEPECMTCRPREGWPSDRGEPPEPWGYASEPGALDHYEGGDLTVWQFVPREATDE